MMKKLLFPVLAAVLLLGLCMGLLPAAAPSAQAAEADAEAIYSPAPEFLQRLGIVEEDEGGLRLEEPVSREEAALLIARLLMTDYAPQFLTGASAPFADTSGWSAGYIAWLREHGIVNGKSETRFDPSGSITGVEFAKLLLCSLGYGELGEYVGSGWDINTIRDANSLGLFEGTGAADLTAPATRGECFLYLYNVLFKDFVTYDGTNGRYVATEQTPADAFGLSDPEPGMDVFGRLIWFYTIENRTAFMVPNRQAYKGSFTALNSALLYDAIGPWAAYLTEATVVTDGVWETVALDPIKQGDVHSNSGLMIPGGSAELYLDDGHLTIAVWYEHIGPAVVGAGTNSATVNGLSVPRGFTCEKDDMVLYTKAADLMQSAEVVRGTVGAYTANNVYGTAPTVGGVKYAYSPTNTENRLPNLPTGTDYVVYTDSRGAIIYAEPIVEAPVIPTDYLYLISADAQDHRVAIPTGLLDTAVTREAAVLMRAAFPDGRVETVAHTVTEAANGMKTVRFNGYTYTLEANSDRGADALKQAMTPGWYAYKVAEDGSYSLVAVNAMFAQPASGPVTITLGNRSIAGVQGMFATSNTVETILYEDGYVETATGYLNFIPVSESADRVLVSYARNSQQISEIYVFSSRGRPAPVSGPDLYKPAEYVYLAAPGTPVAGGYTYTFTKADGSERTLELSEELSAGVYRLRTAADGSVRAERVESTDAAAYNGDGTARGGHKIVSVESGRFVMADGTVYSGSPTVADLSGSGFTSLAKGQVAVIRAGGRSAFNVWVLGTEAVEEPAPVVIEPASGYCYLVQADARNRAVNGTPQPSDSEAEARAVVRIATADGTLATVEYTLTEGNGGKKTASFCGVSYTLEAGEADDAMALKSAMAPGWYAYTVAEDGSVSLDAPDASRARVADSAVTISKGNRSVLGVTDLIAATDTVENIIYNGRKHSVVSAAGYLNFVSVTAEAGAVLVTYAPGSSLIESINIYYPFDVSEPAPKPELIYLLGPGSVYVTGTEYSCVMPDGSLKTFLIAGETLSPGVYYLTLVSQNKPVLSTVYGVRYAQFNPDGTVADASVVSYVDATFFQTKDGTIYNLNPKDPAVVTDVTGNGIKALAPGQIVALLTSTVEEYTYVTNIWIVG